MATAVNSLYPSKGLVCDNSDDEQSNTKYRGRLKKSEQIDPEEFYTYDRFACEEARNCKDEQLEISEDTISNSALETSHFRSTHPITRHPDQDEQLRIQNISAEGLDALNVSASGQYTAKGLQKLFGIIEFIYKENTSVRKEPIQITIVDLRQEAHGFDSQGVSYYSKKCKDEEQLLKAIKGRTEKDLIDLTAPSYRLHVNYHRVPVRDHHAPEPAAIDQLVKIFQSTVDWKHFHCKKGAGRASTAMVLDDIWHNAKKGVSLGEIICRQHILGGSHLSRNLTGSKGERFEFIKSFYQYRMSGSTDSFSQWIANNSPMAISESEKKEQSSIKR